ncbi:MAG: hypothetical protein MUE44_03280 [Oscillatoriaceae cyanobacterium Prado104]|nr:hypothetical protein [Oscillatoriaceae cyanobacterium Prado104]
MQATRIPVIKLSANRSIVEQLTAKHHSQQQADNCTFNPAVGLASSLPVTTCQAEF